MQNDKPIAVPPAPIVGLKDLKSRFSSISYSFFVPGFGLLLLTILTFLFLVIPNIYFAIMKYWIAFPFQYPFLDLETVTSWASCWGKGIDVYAVMPCDILGRPVAYSPIWPRLSFLAVDKIWTPALGLGILIPFLFSLGFIAIPKCVWHRVVLLMGFFSCLPMYAMERANVDIIIFLLAVAAALLLGGCLGLRIVGYVAILLAGLLKFYPLALLGIVLRERLSTCVAIGFACFAMIITFVVSFWDELVRMSHNIPHGAPLGDMLGAKTFPTGFGAVLEAYLTSIGVHGNWVATLPETHLVAYIFAPPLFLAALTITIHLVLHANLGKAMDELPMQDRRFMLIGAALICGCFFTGQSISYRGVFLLFALPSMVALTQSQIDRPTRLLFLATTGATLFVLWELLIRRLVANVFGGQFMPVQGSLAGYTTWVIQECAWWWVAIVLLAVLLRFALDSPAAGELSAIFSRHEARFKCVKRGSVYPKSPPRI